MMKRVIGMLLALGMAGQLSAAERDVLARFDGGIGVIPASNGVGQMNLDGTFPNVKLNAFPRLVAPLSISSEAHLTVTPAVMALMIHANRPTAKPIKTNLGT